ncbi:MAG: tRNA pseudouridine(38-40) synthase TruA [Deltaproteobacteria bacterium]|nr:MAG: tRNA pseudouridine(38-40) synthase TruA [Deltaproteobacteria bacterium]
MVLEYDGTRFAGWQVQPGQRTVQAEIEAALERFLGHPVRVSVAGRTDAGVHALGQVISFETRARRPVAAMAKALNGMLPDDVAVVTAREVPLAFDPRRWAWSKHYRYRWLDRDARSPLRAPHVWKVRGPLDVAAMDAAAALLVGRHDFGAFRAVGCAAAHAVREVTGASVTRVGDEVHLDVHGNGFLRHMVRIIAGTLHEVGRGAQGPAWVGEVLASQDRARAGRTAPAAGLTKIAVHYEEGPPPWHGGGPLDESSDSDG